MPPKSRGGPWGRLTAYLTENGQPAVALRFHDVERIIGRPLPASVKYPAFWSNSSSYAKAWREAGYVVSRAGCLPDELRFLRASTAHPPAGSIEPGVSPPVPPRGAAWASVEPQGGERPGLLRRLLSRSGGEEATTPVPVEAADLVLVGCVKTKQVWPAPAKDLYVSSLFQEARAYAERRGGCWFVLSAKHGLVEPDEWLSPYDFYLADMPEAYRLAWGRWVVARLQQAVGDLSGRRVEVHASEAYASAIRDLLHHCGADVQEPLHGLSLGQRLSWYSGAEALGGDVPMAPSAATVPAASVARSAPGAREKGVDPLTGRDHERDAAIAAAILRYRAEHVDVVDRRVAFAHSWEATNLLYDDPFAFLIGVVFDEGVLAERAWQAPYELLGRLGHLDPWLLKDDLNRVRAAVVGPPALHRFVDVMARATVAAAERVCHTYGGDASRIWAPGSNARQVDERLRAFERIGQKKAAMAVELLVSRLGVELTEMHGSDIAYDVHVRRVFLRAGLVDRDSVDSVRTAARRLHPDRPGLLDLPTWSIGRQWCRPRDPDHAGCPLGDVCPRLVDRGAHLGA